MSEKIYLTEEGRQKLVDRLEYLTKTELPAIVERIKIAREQGDLSENAEYTSARDEQARVSGEISEIEAQLKVAVIYSQDDRKKGVVSIGSTVKVFDGLENEEATYQIVGTAEANIIENKISNESLVGKSLLGRKIGETVEIDSQMGKYFMKILEILS
jgi:transcription elongation factor GreA